MTAQATGLGRRMAKGAVWMVLLRFMMRGLGLLSMLILARLLTPADFGVATLAFLAVGMLASLSDFRPDLALIREQDADRRHYDTVWTLTVIRAAIMAAILALCAEPYAAFFDEPRLVPIIHVFAVMALLEGFSNIGVVDFFKDLQLQKQFRLMFASRFGGFLVTVGLAVVWRNYWALVLGMVTGRLLPVALSYVMHAYRPRFSLALWRDIARFSIWVMLNNILMFFYNRSDTFVVGKLVGASPLGLYSISRRLSNLPSSELAAPIRQAIFPGYAKIANDPDKLRKGFVDAFSLILMIAVPLSVGIGMTAEPLVKVLLGRQWLDTIPLVEVLVIFGLLTVCTANSGPVFLALGKPHVMSWITGTATVLVVPLLLWGVGEAGVVGAAWAMTAIAAVVLAFNILLVIRFLRLPPSAIAASAWRTLVATAAMALSVWLVEDSWPGTGAFVDSLGLLVVAATVGATVYAGTLLSLWRLCGLPEGAEGHIVAVVRTRLPGRARAGAV